MSGQPRHLVSIQDLSPEEIHSLLESARRIQKNPEKWAEHCSGKILATLFFEASTRTRLSFEAAMHRLGGKVISASGAHGTSAAKGESLEDTIRIVSGYADLIVLRHPEPGSAARAAEQATVPVVNAGDGGNEHPTQTLTDLVCLDHYKKTVTGLTAVLAGDLIHSRTAHSLAQALLRLGSGIILAAPEGMEFPPGLLQSLAAEGELEREELSLPELWPGTFAGLWPRGFEGRKDRADILYMTRYQEERKTGKAEEYPQIQPETLASPFFQDAILMHPLPRVQEIPPNLDNHPRSVYFTQAALGVPARMALISRILG